MSYFYEKNYIKLINYRLDSEYTSSKAKNAKHMARDQEGSRLLQKWISQNNQKIINEIFFNVVKINFEMKFCLD